MQSPVLTIFLPAALAIVMLGLGLLLTPADFRRILQLPRVIGASILVQFIALPAVAVVIAKAFDLQPELAVGFVLLASAPSGATATLLAHLASADVAIALTITAVSSLLSLAAVTIAVCMRNVTLAITVAGSASRLNSMTMAAPAAVYSLIMFFTAAAFGFAMRPKAGSAGQETPAA